MFKTFLILSFLMLYACGEPVYNEEKTITKYVDKKYKDLLIKDGVKILKCNRDTLGIMEVIYTKHIRDNAFPATIRMDLFNIGFKVYFDNAYNNTDKAKLIKDIDDCMDAYKNAVISKKTWE